MGDSVIHLIRIGFYTLLWHLFVFIIVAASFNTPAFSWRIFFIFATLGVAGAIGYLIHVKHDDHDN